MQQNTLKVPSSKKKKNNPGNCAQNMKNICMPAYALATAISWENIYLSADWCFMEELICRAIRQPEYLIYLFLGKEGRGILSCGKKKVTM